jgi:hypothetical protein
MSRFFKSAFVSLAVSASLFAQDVPPPTPAPKEKKPKEGFIRFWNLLPKDKGNLLLSKNDGTPEGQILLSAIPLNNYSGYNSFPIGRYALKVSHAADPATAIQTFDLILRENVFVTILSSFNNGKVKAELFDDTYDPSAITSGRLVIYHQFSGLRVVVAGGRQTSRPIDAGESETIEGFTLGPVEFQMVGSHLNGKLENWSTEIDFSKFPHASLVVVPDPYGRFRPRVSIDGKSPTGSGN